MGTYSETTISSAVPNDGVMDATSTAMTTAGWTLVETVYAAISGTGTLTGAATTSATSTTITRSGGTNWTAGALRGLTVSITSGTGSGQYRTIALNTTSVITVDTAWSVTPDATSVFSIVSKSLIFKSPSASNVISADFYIAVFQAGTVGSATNTTLNFSVFEQWDATNKKAIYYVPGSSSNAPDGSYRTNDATGVLIWSLPRYVSVYPEISTSFVFRINADINRIAFGCSAGTAAATIQGYLGVFDSFLSSAADPMPLVQTTLAANSSATFTSAFTREPGQASGSTSNWCIQFGSATNGLGGSTSMIHALYPFVCGSSLGSASYPSLGLTDVYRTNVASRIWFFSNRGYSQASSVSPRGILRDVYVALPGGAAGDTLSVTGGDLVLPAAQSSAYFKMFIPKF